MIIHGRDRKRFIMFLQKINTLYCLNFFQRRALCRAMAYFMVFAGLLAVQVPAKANLLKPCEVATDGHVTRYVPQLDSEKEKSVAVIILPPTGGKNILDNHLARNFCDSGYDTSILDYAQIEIDKRHNPNPNKPVALHNLTENRVHIDADYLSVYEYGSQLVMGELELLLSKYKTSFKNKKIVLVGASMGGFFTSIIFGAVSKTKQWDQEGVTSLSEADLKVRGMVASFPNLMALDGAIIVTAGGSVSEVWTSSSRKEIVNAIKLRKEIYRLQSDQEYIELFDGHNDFDTLKLANPQAKDKILFFNSDSDTVVPSKFQEKLWAHWGEPQKVTVGFEHMYAISEVYLYPEHFTTMLEFIRLKWP